MFGCKELKRKKAGVSIEFLLSAVLGLAVIFLALGIFSTNVEGMTANGGINNLLHNNKTTDNQNYNRDYTNSQIVENKTQIDVGTIASPGQTLADYLAQAQKTIDDLAKLPQPLTDPMQLNNLAEALTELNFLNGTLDTNNADLAGKNSITIKQTRIGRYTNAGDKQIPWDVKIVNPQTDDEKIADLKDIKNAFKNS